VNKINYDFLLKYISEQNLFIIINFIEKYGIIAGITLPIIETFMPFFPLVFFVTINVLVFGFLEGYIYSYIGNTVGSILLFSLVRYLRKKKLKGFFEKHERFLEFQGKLKTKDFNILFILFSFPFTPSFLVTGLAAIYDFQFIHFLISLLLGKLIMIFSLAFIGFNISSFFENPLRSFFLIILIILINYIGKLIIDKKQKR